MAQAVEDGTAFTLDIPGWTSSYFPPAATDPSEVVLWALQAGFLALPGELVVHRVIALCGGTRYEEEVLRFEDEVGTGPRWPGRGK